MLKSSRVSLLLAAAAAVSALAPNTRTVQSPRRSSKRRVQVQQMKVSSSQEIADWNAAVDARKAAKKGR